MTVAELKELMAVIHDGLMAGLAANGKTRDSASTYVEQEAVNGRLLRLKRAIDAYDVVKVKVDQLEG
jgi:hypothetical protein